MDQEIVEALKEPSYFYYHGSNDQMFITWGLCGPSVNRDSSPLDQSNYYAILEDIKEKFPDDYQIVSSSHWAVGWVDQVAIRVLDSNGEPTEIFEFLKDVSVALSDYPVYDEEDFSRREHEDALETIEWHEPAFEFTFKDKFYEVIDELPSDSASQVFSYIFDTFSYAWSDEIGEDEVLEAYVALGYAKEISDE